MNLWNVKSIIPPKYPWIAPAAIPMIELSEVKIRPNKIEILNPYIRRANTSLPWSSVPSQFTLSGGEGADTFTPAALVLNVTPSIIGDGNVLLDVKVNNDTPNSVGTSGAIGINTMEIATKLLVADGDIVVIGGIKKNNVSSEKEGVPGVSKLPILGKIFQGNAKQDTLNELLVFIAPRIL